MKKTSGSPAGSLAFYPLTQDSLAVKIITMPSNHKIKEGSNLSLDIFYLFIFFFEFSAHTGAHTVACNGQTKQNKIRERNPNDRALTEEII